MLVSYFLTPRFALNSSVVSKSPRSIVVRTMTKKVVHCPSLQECFVCFNVKFF